MKEYRNTIKRVTAALLALLLVCGAAPALADSPSDYNKNVPQLLTEGNLYAEASVLVDAENGDVLFSKNARARMYPASTTKVMTLLLALESGIAMDTPIVIPQQAAQIPADSSLVPVFPGDMMSFRDLLYGFMLTSGNDGANAIAVLVSGNVEAFVDRMNQRARELGCEDTHFANPHGYHDPQHYSTALDLARIACEAVKLDSFRKITSTPSYTMSIRRGNNEIETRVTSSNSLLKKDNTYYYPDCIGIKTGYHSMAGQCFVGAAERDGVRYIDDSKATSLAALAAGVTMAGARVRLIAGGLPKGDDPESVTSLLPKRVKKVYTIGRSAEAFAAAWSGSVECEICGTMERAVAAAVREVQRGETVLLSPGCASFDQFNNFGERGDVFAQLVKREGTKEK